MNRKTSDDSYSEREAQHRFEAALRGARVAGHKTMRELSGSERKRDAMKPRAPRPRKKKA